MKVLLVAYACEPGKGSEPGVGWNTAIELSSRHEVFVLTRANNRAAIEEARVVGLGAGVTWLYHDLPRWARFWKRGNRGVQLYYYLWQRSAARLVKRAAADHAIELVHHVTFVKYWAPSAGAGSGTPFVWGPVGGGEQLPEGFWRGLSWKSCAHEFTRVAAQRLLELDPSVRKTARSASVALCTTRQTARRVESLGSSHVRLLGESALSSADLARLMDSATAWGSNTHSSCLRLIFMGRLIGWKGVHLAVRALASVDDREATLDIVGDGPEKARLVAMCEDLGVGKRVRFHGALERDKALSLLGKADVLIHPSLHDSGGWVCLEAMAAGRPVICLEWGGPGMQVTSESGIPVAVGSPKETVEGLAAAIRTLSSSPELRETLGAGGRRRVGEAYAWAVRVDELTAIYDGVIAGLEG